MALFEHTLRLSREDPAEFEAHRARLLEGAYRRSGVTGNHRAFLPIRR
jgi:hypothetical protein